MKKPTRDNAPITMKNFWQPESFLNLGFAVNCKINIIIFVFSDLAGKFSYSSFFGFQRHIFEPPS